MRSSKRTAHTLIGALLGIAIGFVTPRPLLADDLRPAAAGPVEPALEANEAAESEPSLEELGVSDAVVDRPGLKWWAIDTAVISAVTWGATLAINQNIREGVMSSSGQQWLDNISHAPEWNDGSNSVTNYVAHPMLGATWFLAYRSRGHGFVASSLGLIFQSLWLEYAIEGPYNIPSVHDMVFTPLIGIPVGYGLDSLSVYLLKKDDQPLRYLGYLFNPFRLLPTAKNDWKVAIDPANKRFAISGRF